MRKVDLNTYSPKDILVKEAFKRAIPSEDMTQRGITHLVGDASALYDDSRDHLRYELFSQADFLREYDVNSHKINSMKYYPNPLRKDSDGKYYAKVKTRVAIGWQERIHTKRLTALIGNNANIRITSSRPTDKDQEMLGLFREGWEEKNMENAISDGISADGKVGDVAVCFYMSGGKLGWRVFSYENGDTLYPHYDPITGKLSLLGRKYSMRGEDGKAIAHYLDVWDNTHYMRYRYDTKGIKGIITGIGNALGVEGWTVDEEPVPHGFQSIPVAYDRYGGPFWANSQNLIENHEMSVSQLCENNMAYALRILYSFGAEMDMKSTIDGTPVSINGVDPNSKVGFLEPADASSSFTLQLDTLEKNIMRSSFVVETPEIKSGSDMSSLTVKMLFADTYLKALQDAMHFQPFLDKIVECFKYGYGIETGRVSEFSSLKVKAELFPYIFQSETEIVSGIVQLKGIGALSRKSASEMAYEYGYGVIGENRRILDEEHEEMTGKSGQQTGQKDVNVISKSRGE